MKKEYYFVSWNVNGVRAIARKDALHWVDEEVPDILGLQEIKAEKEQIPNNLFEHSFANTIVSSSEKKGQSGVAIFSDIKIDYSSPCYSVDILKEGRINEIHFDNIAFFNVYFPNGKRSTERLAYKMKFYERFFDHIELLRKKGMSIIFCGDVNTAHNPIDIARPKDNENISGFLDIERAWIDKLMSAGYIDTFRYIHKNEANRYSWWSMRTRARGRNVGWRIDYFFVSADLKEDIVDADILDTVMGSDHAPIILRLKK